MKWFRFYHDAIDDPKVQLLEPARFKFWVNILCLASRSEERGTIALSVGEVAFALRMTEVEASEHIAALVEARLLEPGESGLEIHNWNARQFKSDDVSARVAQHRKAAKQPDPDNETTPKRHGAKRETLNPTLPDGTDETLQETLKPSARADSETDSETEETQTHNAGVFSQRQAFETFRAAYPHGHINPQPAWEAWRRLDPDSEMVEVIMLGLERWKASDQWSRRGFVKHAHNWLSERWWDMDPPEERPWPDTSAVPRPSDDMTEEEQRRFYLRDVLERQGA